MSSILTLARSRRLTYTDNSTPHKNQNPLLVKTKTTTDFLDDIKTARNVTSDYAVAKILETRHSNISNYRNGKSRFDGVMCLKVAAVLGVNPGYVLACMEAERAKDEEVRKVWEKAAQVLEGASTHP